MKKLIVANWKCNPKNRKEAERIFSKIKNRNIVICPPSPFIPFLKGALLGAQDCFYKEGAYTGEVSASMLKSLGCKYVIIGHSERRYLFNETNEIINRKIKSVLENKMIPIFCIGETSEERGKVKAVLRKQMKEGLKGVDSKKVVIAYEPVWAIGTSNPCSPKEAEEMRNFIFLLSKTKVLYGGSVNSANFKDYSVFDGLLVGGASLKPEEIRKIASGFYNENKRLAKNREA